MDIYGGSIAALALTCALPVILASVSGMSKGKAGAIGGPVPDAREDNPLFRIDRTHVNAVESIPVFVAAAILAMLAGVGPGLLGWLAWLFLAVRIGHAAVYLRGGSLARGGSLRTFLHVAASVIALVVIVATVIAALT